MPKYRMIHVDHYMCHPTLPFDDTKSECSGKPASKVPVIRIFGADVDGRKICIHVHGFYPYVAIQNKEPDNPEIIGRVVADIERALVDMVDSNRRNQPKTDNRSRPVDQPPDAGTRQEHRPLFHLSADQKSPVHRIESIQSYNYYGYHHNLEHFLKIHLYNPKMVKQVATLFQDYKVLDRFVPVFWAHLPYILLFFIDNNLRGMQFIELDQVYWRKGKAPKSGPNRTRNFSDNTGTDETNQLGEGTPRRDFMDDCSDDHSEFTTDVEPTSTCELEADIRFEWILNRQRFGSKGNDDALRELWLDDQEPTQISSQIDLKLPLFNLERDYLHQLCEAYQVDYQSLDLEIAKTPAQVKTDAPEPDFSDSDDESRNLFQSRDDQESLSSSPEIPTAVDAVKTLEDRGGPSRHDGEIKPLACEDDEFSDDDEDFERNVAKILQQINPKPNVANLTSRSGSQRSLASSRETVSHEYQYLCLMSMELHISTRGKLRPDPAFDPIESVFYCIRNDVPEDSKKPAQIIGMIVTDPFGGSAFDAMSGATTPDAARSPSARSNMSFAQKNRTLLHRTGLSLNDIELNIVDTELELIITLVEIVRSYDPEIMAGYEMEQLSWGYLLERANILNIAVGEALSRVTDTKQGQNSKVVESNFVQPIMFTGRMVFSTWRMIRHEINLNTCSYERIHHHALNERVPCFAFDTLTRWFNQNRNRWRVIDYYLIRVVGQMRILDKFDLIAKISELARVYGTQFIDVITRGSQIGIESMMLRLAKLQNLTPLSPTVTQRNQMKAPEALPLVMEPETNIYYDPVAVLDFQSLYPSVVIAYNYCYSTCLGRVSDLENEERHKFGCSQLFVPPEEIKRLIKTNSIHVSPCGVAFVKKNIRHGVLPKMLNELIVTRAMVKDQMKKNMKSERPNRRLQRILDHRQHGLKMMANTTYGYTGASYTGRMPCVEIADSIVSKGRETLEKAIELVESRADWGGKVIYGDTDSMFIQFKDCDRETAFKRAYEMVEAITAANPHPIKMKFEKIYQPCVLQTKKRYCGFKYEFPEQEKPEFEAKGIETVRRDCCPVAAQMLEMALRIQFTSRDVDQVKNYVQHKFVKIMSGKLSHIQDYIFARQYKPRDLDKTESVFVPAWQITKRMLAIDPRAEPRFNERIPFVITYGEKGTPLVNLAKTPMEVLENLSYRINADYYIQKIICPTLNRVFCTLKVDTLLWYKSMPHQNIIDRSHYLAAQKKLHGTVGAGGTSKQSTMSQYFSPSHCPVCAKSIPMSDDICDLCRDDLQSSAIRLTEEISRNQRKLFAYHQLCRACSTLERCDNGDDEFYNPCISYDCHNLFQYHQAKLDVLNSNFLSHILKNLN